MKIFVSYTVRDLIISTEFLMEVSKMLSSIGSPYVDLIHNNSIDKQARVEKELTKANVLLLLNSLSVSTSPWVQWELEKAKNLGIPIRSIKIKDEIPDLQQILRVLEG